MRLIHRLIPKTCALHAALIFILFLLSILLYACEGIAAEFTGKVVGVIAVHSPASRDVGQTLDEVWCCSF